MMDHETNDATLLRRFHAQGEEEAFAQLVARHSAMVLGVCRRILPNAHDADDAAQATFVALSLKAGRLTAVPNLGGWLHHVARHVALDMQKAIARRERRHLEHHLL